MRGFGLVRSLNSAATDQHETSRSEGRRGRRLRRESRLARAMCRTDFSLRSKPPRGGTRKIRMAQAVAMPQGAAWGRPERATDPQAAWRKTRNDTVWSCVYVGISRWFLGNERGSAAGVTFQRFATRATGRRAQRDGGMPCAERFWCQISQEPLADARRHGNQCKLLL